MTTQDRAGRPRPDDLTANSFVIEPGTVGRSNKRVRAFSSGELVVDSRSPLQSWEYPNFPEYFFAASDLKATLRPSGQGARSRVLGVSEIFDVLVGERVVPYAARRFPKAKGEILRDAFALNWSAFDTWMEEDEVVYTHPRSPFVRVDALASSRHVTVRCNGATVAESHRPVVLYETGVVPRYYLPRVDVRMDWLIPTASISGCPYKGTATYWNLAVNGAKLIDVAWSYPTPLPESMKIAGLVAFWPEKSAVLEVDVDGQRIGWPRS